MKKMLFIGLIFSILIISILTIPVKALDWKIETIDFVGDNAGINAIALDHSNYPHIGYNNETRDLKYSYQDASGWHNETIDNFVGYPVSFTLDGNDHPHFAYVHQYEAYYEKYAYKDNFGWHTEITSTDQGVSDISLAIDGSNNPHISWEWSGKLRYTYKNGASWYTETVDSDSDYFMGDGNSLVLDSSGTPHISYVAVNLNDVNGDAKIKYAWKDADGWHTQIVDHIGKWFGTGTGGTSLKLDAENHPHISYISWLEGLKYASNDGTSWNTEIVDNRYGSKRVYTSLALDKKEYPHITYAERHFTESLNYAYKDSSGWNFDIVQHFCGANLYSSLVLDSTDLPHISYLDECDETLKYASVYAGGNEPVANAGQDKTVIVNEAVMFDGSGSTDSDGTVVSYAWKFGDTKSATGMKTTHVYATKGTYIVTLTVTDNDGLTGTDTAIITVKTPAQTLKDLITKVDGLGLPKGIEQSLLAKLNVAQMKITQKQNTPARNTLNAFINQVNAQRGKALTIVQANELISIAQRIIVSIPGK